MASWTFPYPDGITVNHQYRHTSRGHWLTPQASAWRDYAAAVVRTSGAVLPPEPWALVVRLYPGDRLRRDADGPLKLAVDAVALGLGVDDYRFAALGVRRCAVDRAWPRIEVELRTDVGE